MTNEVTWNYIQSAFQSAPHWIHSTTLSSNINSITLSLFMSLHNKTTTLTLKTSILNSFAHTCDLVTTNHQVLEIQNGRQHWKWILEASLWMFCIPYHLLVQNQNLQLLWCTCKKPNDIVKWNPTYTIHSHHHNSHISQIRNIFYLQRVEDIGYIFMLVPLIISTDSEWLKLHLSLAKKAWMELYLPSTYYAFMTWYCCSLSMCFIQHTDNYI
jgi:hypothetical protein